jgi:hypothetical protein
MNLTTLLDDHGCSDESPSGKFVWACGRGRTRLSCQLRRHSETDFEVEVTRNGRLYGAYRFDERMAAVAFALRLRHTFEGNGWSVAA